MFIDFTDEQKALRKELQAYYTNLITPEIHELQKLEEGTGPVRRKLVRTCPRRHNARPHPPEPQRRLALP